MIELENTVRQLQYEKAQVDTDRNKLPFIQLTPYISEHEAEKKEHKRKLELMEQDIRQALERIKDLESENEALTKIREENSAKQVQINKLREQIVAEQERHERGITTIHPPWRKRKIAIYCTCLAMKAAAEAHENAIHQLQESAATKQRSEADDASRQDEREAMDRIMELLHDENTSLRQQLADKEQELQELKQKATAKEQNKPSATLNTKDNEAETETIDVYGMLVSSGW